MTPAGAQRAARFADGLNPIAFSHEQLTGLLSAFHAAAREAGRDPSDLSVVVRANVPISAQPLDGDRPYLGGSPEQIADDLAHLDEAGGVDQVLFNNTSVRDLDDLVGLLADLPAAVAAFAGHGG